MADPVLDPLAPAPLLNAAGQPTAVPSPQPVPPVAGYTPAQGTAAATSETGYTATPYTVKPEGTVAGQLETITKKGSPLMDLAGTQAKQDANSRGLLNSSIAVGAGQDALYRTALPIAQADAGFQNAAMTNTANQENAASQFGAAATNSAQQLNAQLLTSMNTTNANAANAAMSQEAQAANARSLAVIDTNTRVALAQLDTQNRALLQSSVGASNAYVQAVTNISNIATNPTLSKEAKDAATASQMNMLNEQLRTLSAIAATEAQAVSSLNLDEFFQQEDLPPVVTAGPAGPAGPAGSTTYTGANGLQYATQEQANNSMTYS